MRWRLAGTYALVILGAVALIGVLVTLELDRTARSLVLARLEAEALLLRELTVHHLGDPAALDAMAKARGRELGTRITIIAPDGTVWADSDSSPAQMENHGRRPEVQAAAAGERGVAVRPSRTLGPPMLYVAVPLQQAGELQAVVRTALSLAQVETAQSRLRTGILLSLAGGGLLALAASVFLARRITRPLEVMTDAARAIAAGDLSQRVEVETRDEMGVLAAALNHMASALEEKVGETSEGRDRLEVILRHMSTGVFFVDRARRVTLLNPAARQMLGYAGLLPAELPRVVADFHLAAAVGGAMEGRESALELEVAGRHLSAAVVPTYREGRRSGVVVVLHDMTAVRRVEAMRRDLIANVSHELKTPITAIQGLAETLLQGALEEPETLRRFLTIIHQEGARLSALTRDLTDLVRLEADPGAIRLQSIDLAAHLRAVLARLRPRAEAVGVALHEELPPDPVSARVDPDRIDQLLTNLVENALRHTPKGGEVRVRLAAGRDLDLSVSDTGSGISPEHLPRIFERFYRVDPGRSRKAGGTGLGLAIVKHIAERHGGRVQAASTVGAGTTVTVSLPRP